MRRFHLPAMARVGVRPVSVIDLNLEVAQRTASVYGIPRADSDYRTLIGSCDAVLVAVPSIHHASISLDLLRHGMHLMVEKPLATAHRDCVELVRSAIAMRRVIAVGLMRRYLASMKWTKALLRSGALGRILSFDLREGQPMAWEVQSPSFYSRSYDGGGVLADTGAHSLDILLWWLGPLTVKSYRDDSRGGVEADCLLELGGDARGMVELSRTRWLRNSVLIKGEYGELEASLFANSLRATPHRVLRLPFDGLRGDRLATQSIDDLFVCQLRGWLAAIGSEAHGLLPSPEATESVRLIEECYRVRSEWRHPWEQFTT